MERISIFNYEAFYLDYLEGALSSEDERMLLDFLEEHPECKIEGDELPSLDSSLEFSFVNKEALKQVDELEAVSLGNVEHFMIAESEQILQEDKSLELERFLTDKPSLQEEMKVYKSVYFDADSSLQFANKGSLKKREAIVLWPYLAVGAAAAAAVFIFMFGGDQTKNIIEGTETATPMAEEHVEQDVKPNNEIQQLDDKVIMHADRRETPSTFTATESTDALPKKLNNKPVKPMQISLGEKKLMPVTTYSIVPKENQTAGPALVQNDQREMNNPIAPITNFISSKTKSDVDFGYKPKSKKEKSGFFLKIGRFELSRNKH